MDLISLQLKETNFPSPLQKPPGDLQYIPKHTNLDTNSGFNLDNKVSPSILLIIIILAIIFFISGLLHLLVRFLLKPPATEQDEIDSVTALQGQLQQLFHLHDAGVDQSFIDTLPVFQYKDIIGLKNPFDCAVCLCEFEPEDKLRLLPKCSHAFHTDCIDTWLLSHSTCPLCRASLIPSDFSQNNNVCSPIVFVLESGSERSREIVNDRDQVCNVARTSSVLTTNTQLGYRGDNELGSSRIDFPINSSDVSVDSWEKVVAVKLGKFRNVDVGEGTSNEENADARRCYSMGSFEYVMDENSLLKVPIRIPFKKQSSKKPWNLPLTPGHRPAMSECDCESRREFNGFDGFKSFEASARSPAISASVGGANGSSKTESYSISKIWLRGKKDKQSSREGPTGSSSRRAFSFRFPLDRANSNLSNTEEFRVENTGRTGGNGPGLASECSFDEESQGCNSMDSRAKTPSFSRKTLLWLVGRQTKVVDSPSTTDS